MIAYNGINSPLIVKKMSGQLILPLGAKKHTLLVTDRLSFHQIPLTAQFYQIKNAFIHHIPF